MFFIDESSLNGNVCFFPCNIVVFQTERIICHEYGIRVTTGTEIDKHFDDLRF